MKSSENNKNECLCAFKDMNNSEDCDDWTDRQEIISYISEELSKFSDQLKSSMKEIAKEKINQWFECEKDQFDAVPITSKSLFCHNGKDFLREEESISSPKSWASYLKLFMVDLNKWIPLLETGRKADISQLAIRKELMSALEDFEKQTITEVLTACFMSQFEDQNLMYL